ncbi:hypothetical protein HJ526_16765 [Donghicola sp. C2-DW-16]|uniref:Type IV pilus biogenesis protein PilP n=1 Tax=Donghicola mangrovi TaxID=2729614 RepID=A0ABX2PHU9_9RHOB|nr:hypothetical protein [Donghicola mangrovi]NVO29083.1 hypothetical protein [Donghicola mangrovi]
MITNFALSLTFNGIRLLQRGEDGWLLVGDVALDAADLPAALAKLRDRALALSPDGLRCKIVIPDEQIRYLTMSGVAPGQERSAARIALEGATPYRVEQLNFDCVRLTDGNVSVAAVAHETLDEAEAFALEHGFNPYSFGAIPEPSANYPAEPYLGTSLHAREVMPKGEEVQRDFELIRITGEAQINAGDLGGDDKIPLPDFGGAVENSSLSALHAATKEREAEVEAPFIEVSTPDEDPEPTPDLSAATLTAHRTAPKAPAAARKTPLKAERTSVAAGMFTVIGGMLASTKLPLPKGQDHAKLGLMATAAVILFMGVVGATATLFTGDKPAEITAQSEPVAIPVTTVPAEELDTAELESEPDTDTDLTTPAPSSEETDEALAMHGDAVDLLPVQPTDPAPEAAPEQVAMTPEQLQDLYARTGIYAMAPVAPTLPDVPSDADVYVPSKDRAVPSLDAVSLPETNELALDELPPRQGLPTAAEHKFALDENGLVRPTPEGTLAPGGYRVFLGNPPVVPPTRPETAPAETEVAEAEPEAPAYKIRPQARPDDLAEKLERSRLGGLTMAEMASRRPKARPDDLVPAPPAVAEAPAASPETAAAVMDALREASGGSTAGISEEEQEDLVANSSLMPKARPKDLAPAPSKAAPVQVASAATKKSAAPSLPSKASVTKAATEDNVISLKEMNLIGVYGSDSNRRALIRLPNGRYKKVQVGDKIEGSKVTAISADAIRLVKGSRNVVLSMPKG